MLRGQPQNRNNQRQSQSKDDMPTPQSKKKMHATIWEEICSQVQLMESKQQTPIGD